MLAAKVRSGIVETVHDGALAVVDGSGRVVASSGDLDRPFFIRSAAKPFQAFVAQLEGALLRPVEMALACSSHDGQPVHVAIVEGMLRSVGLGTGDLRCPPAWPLAATATQRLQAAGHVTPRAVWHNCSGKHAAWLRACVARDWPLPSYLGREHPIQARVASLLSELGNHAEGETGIDGCGAPVPPTTTRSMALLYARLAVDPALRPVYRSMHTYPALVSGTGNGDAVIATSFPAAAKWGAEGTIGIAVEHQFGLAVKSWDGSQQAAMVAAIAALRALGVGPAVPDDDLRRLERPPVYGGGQVVGALEPRVELRSREKSG